MYVLGLPEMWNHFCLIKFFCFSVFSSFLLFLKALQEIGSYKRQLLEHTWYWTKWKEKSWISFTQNFCSIADLGWIKTLAAADGIVWWYKTLKLFFSSSFIWCREFAEMCQLMLFELVIGFMCVYRDQVLTLKSNSFQWLCLSYCPWSVLSILYVLEGFIWLVFYPH